MLWLFLWATAPTLTLASGTEHIDIPTAEHDAMSVTVYPAAGQDLFIWFTHHEQHSQGFHTVVNGLQSEGKDVWQIDLLDNLFLEETADNLRSVPATAITPVIKAALDRGYEHITLLGTELLSGAVLRGIRHWQVTEQPDSATRKRVSGSLLFFPIFTAFTPTAGEPPSYQAILDASNYPLMIFQPGKGKNSGHLGEILQHLNTRSGSAFAWVRPGLLDWYFLYREEDPAPAEPVVRQSKQLPRRIIRAAALLAGVEKPDHVLPLNASHQTQQSVRGLVKWESPAPALAVTLPDLRGQAHELSDWRGHVTLVNFWASWCGPCVEEIPSMNRLKKQLENKNFRMVGINFREELPEIQDFTKKIPVGFTILRDEKGIAATQWKANTFPSSFLVDAQGRIRYSVNAAMDWSSPNAIKIIESLMLEPQEGQPQAQTEP